TSCLLFRRIKAIPKRRGRSPCPPGGTRPSILSPISVATQQGQGSLWEARGCPLDSAPACYHRYHRLPYYHTFKSFDEEFDMELTRFSHYRGQGSGVRG